MWYKEIGGYDNFVELSSRKSSAGGFQSQGSLTKSWETDQEPTRKPPGTGRPCMWAIGVAVADVDELKLESIVRLVRLKASVSCDSSVYGKVYGDEQ